MCHVLYFNLFRRLLCLALTFLLGGCAGRPIASFTNERPIFDPMRYFAGRTHSWGLFETRSGQPKALLRTFTQGRLDPDSVLHFEQDLVFEDGRKSHRSWLVRRVDAHHYTATGTGIVGVARGAAYGNTFHLEFTLDAFPGNPLGRLHMSQWMYLQADGRTMLNRANLKKAGITVTQITEEFRKDR